LRRLPSRRLSSSSRFLSLLRLWLHGCVGCEPPGGGCLNKARQARQEVSRFPLGPSNKGLQGRKQAGSAGCLRLPATGGAVRPAPSGGSGLSVGRGSGRRSRRCAREGP
jgi:hypothetical protein